jgi:hypothetical protein
MFDPNGFVVGGVSLLVVVFGLVEFVKAAFNLDGQRVTVLAALMGAILMVAYQLQTLLPAPYSQVYEMFVVSVAFGLSASGYYKFVSARIPPAVG